MTCNTDRAINYKEMIYTSGQHCIFKSHIYLISNLCIVNLGITRQVKYMANKFADSMATEVNCHKLGASVPESSLKFRKFVCPLSWNTQLSDDGVRATSPNLRAVGCKELASLIT